MESLPCPGEVLIWKPPCRQEGTRRLTAPRLEAALFDERQMGEYDSSGDCRRAWRQSPAISSNYSRSVILPAIAIVSVAGIIRIGIRARVIAVIIIVAIIAA